VQSNEWEEERDEDMRTPRPKQPTNPIPEPGTRWVCEPRAKDAPADGSAPAPRIVVVTRTYYDDVRKDTRIEYANEATKRNGATWYKTFQSGAEFTPAPPKEAQPAPVAPPSTAQGQLPLTVGYRPADPALLAVLGRIATALETIARALTTPTIALTTSSFPSNMAAIPRSAVSGS
jgi:hypothetical protein